MEKQKAATMMEEIKKVLKELGYPYLSYFYGEVFDELGEGEETVYCGNQKINIEGRAIATFVYFEKVETGECLTEINFNIPTNSEDFTDGYREGIRQEPGEPLEKFAQRFKQRVLELKMTLMFRPKENFFTVRLLNRAKSEGRIFDLDECALVSELNKKLGSETEEELEIKMMNMSCNMESRDKDGNVVAKFWSDQPEREIEFNLVLVDYKKEKVK